MAPTDLDYFRRRWREETAREAAATRSDVRSVHRQLATLYAERIARLEALEAVPEPRPKLRLFNRTAS